jgi:hypothetical protein
MQKANNPTVDQILIENGLNFEIIKKQLGILPDPNYPKLNLDTPYYGLFNSQSGECIGNFKKGYHVSQNREVVELILKGIEPFNGLINVQKAGSINGGRKVYMNLEVQGFAKVGIDTVKKYITIIDSNDGSTSLSIGFGDLTMRCENQFWKFYKAGEAKFRHSASLEQKIQEIPMLIEVALNQSMRQIELYNNFQSTAITRDLIKPFISNVMELGTKELSGKSLTIFNDISTAIETEINQVGLNIWGLHGGITRYTTHNQKGTNRVNGKIESQLVGTSYKYNQKSLTEATKLLQLA